MYLQTCKETKNSWLTISERQYISWAKVTVLYLSLINEIRFSHIHQNQKHRCMHICLYASMSLQYIIGLTTISVLSLVYKGTKER